MELLNTWNCNPCNYFFSFEGSLLNLAKHAASTVQILGAEKALFRALKSRRDTPKYGLIYHASLVGQTSPKHKGKVRCISPETGHFFFFFSPPDKSFPPYSIGWSKFFYCFFFIRE